MLLYQSDTIKIMKLIHLQRIVSWVASLTYTLFKFWLKNPQETMSILNFITEKITASPKFFSRNVFIESHSLGFEKILLQTTRLYRKYGGRFNLHNPRCLEDLEKICSHKAQILYFLIRKVKPKIVLETGVAAGESTGFVLQAIKDNKVGKLYSIDLPFQWYIYGNHKLHLDSLPAGKMSGYLVPEKLKRNWFLLLGNTKAVLPKLLRKLGKIDIFLHDSEHSYKNMMFEYKQSWPYIKKGGYLISDDINYTEAWRKFTKSKNLHPISFLDIGIIKKNR